MGGTKCRYVDVILPLAIPRQYTYAIPEKLIDSVKPGVSVAVSFGRKKHYSAIAYRIHPNAPQGYTVKEILYVIDPTPIAQPTQIRFWEWMAEYYLCTLGEVMKAALPAGLKLESDSFITPSEVEAADLDEQELFILKLLNGKRTALTQLLPKIEHIKNPMGVIQRMQKKGVIAVNEELSGGYRPKTESTLSFNKSYHSSEALNRILDSLSKAPAQQRVIIGMLSIADNPEEINAITVSKKALLQKVDVSPGVIGAMVKKGILRQDRVTVSRIDTSETREQAPATLTPEQQNALNRIVDQFTTKQVVLLHGITSSGKTEIYIHLIKEAVKRGEQILYLLPEIALTAQIINRLKAVFGNRVGIYHSKYGNAKRVEVYRGVALENPGEGEVQFDIVLGVRSAVFLPFRKLGLIIIDEEHENTFKQFNPAPRYQARDSAIMLANLHGAKTLLGTATPSVETYFNAHSGKYGLVELNQRHGGLALPEIELIDLREARKRKQMHSHFSQRLLDLIKGALDSNRQVILFQNRRGFAPFIECEECGWVPQCEHCDVSLTYHKFSDMLSCHYCGFSVSQPHQCMACGSTALVQKGFGTEKVEDELKIFFPDATIQRLDLDTTRSYSSYERIISEFEEGKTQILIGTQMVSKGLHFDRVSLVGVLNADNMLNFPDFRAFERSFQLISQVSGRAGRKGERGHVAIQTSQPDHPVIKCIINENQSEFYRMQLRERQEFNYPPYYRLIKLTVKHKDRATAKDAAGTLANALRHSLKHNILGPEPPAITRIQGLYLMDIWIKIGRNQPLNRIKQAITRHINGIKENRSLYNLTIAIDVDPH